MTQLLYRPISLEAVDVVDETEEADYLIEDGLEIGDDYDELEIGEEDEADTWKTIITVSSVTGSCYIFHFQNFIMMVESLCTGLRQGLEIYAWFPIKISYYISEGSVSHINGVWPSFLTIRVNL